MNKLLLIDGMSTAYRAFYAIRGLSTSRGQPTNAVFGFIKMLLKMIKDYEPDYIAIVSDSRGPTVRHERYEKYKAQRKPMPADLAGQLPLLKEVAAGYRIPWLELAGYEADDVLATVSRRAAREGFTTLILTGDKDLLQLVDDKVSVISPHKEGTFFDRVAVEERFGVPPSKLAEVLALMGDAIDNVPGVPGVGEKTAVQLVRDYHTLEGVLEHAAEVKNKRVRENLIRYGGQARLSRELVALQNDVPLKWEWKSLKKGKPDQEKLGELFKKLEFKALLEEIAPAGEKPVDYVKLKGEEVASRLSEIILPGRELFFELKADAPAVIRAAVSAAAFSSSGGEKVYLPLSVLKQKEEALPLLGPYLEDKELLKCLHDVKSISHLLLNEGIELQGVVWDTMLVSYLLNPSRSDHTLQTLSRDFLGWSPPPPVGSAGEGEISEEAGEALCQRLAAVMELRTQLRGELEKKKLHALLARMELPLAQVLVRMERNGIALDRGKLGQISKLIGKELGGLTRKMFELAGEEFNLNSPKQLSHILFHKLKLPVQKRTKTGYSTDFNVLQELAARHELPALILRYRQLFKLKSTYVDALPELIDAHTDRIHTTFHQTVTATGRLSSSSPNLQNIPVRTELGRRIRSAFVPRPAGWLFLSADYSQIDLRVLAHLSRDRLLLEAFRRDEDVHAFTASQLFGVTTAKVTPEMRRRAKTVNFGIIYGMGAYGLSQDLKIPYGEADAFIRAYFERYTGVAAYIHKTIESAQKRGYVTTLFHRRRYLPELKSNQESVRRFGERTAINTPIQGSAADIIKLAMIEIDRRLRQGSWQARMLLQIHDELLFEIPEEEIEPLSQLVCEGMENVVKLEVRLKTDVKVGPSWGDLKPVSSEP